MIQSKNIPSNNRPTKAGCSRADLLNVQFVRIIFNAFLQRTAWIMSIN